MHPIRQPELLDPDRITANDRDDMTLFEHRTRAQQLDTALHATCDYATALWQHLDAARHYLYESLPSDPRAPGAHPHIGAAPTGPDDEDGWQRWIDTYATVTSILAGPHGDSGFGLDEAQHAARARCDAPNLRVLERTRHDSAGDSPAAPSAAQPTRTSTTGDVTSTTPAGRSDPWRLAGLGLLVVLALRGIRPRRGSA